MAILIVFVPWIQEADMTVTFERSRVLDSAEVLREERVNVPSPDVTTVPVGWAPAGEAMARIVAVPPTDIAGVLSRLISVQSVLDNLPPSPRQHRVAAFNSLYYTITDRVAAALRGPEVTEPEFLERLDVEFGKRYFTALKLWGENEDAMTPDSWEVLFRRGTDPRVSRLAAAMLGVNAHINFDLAMALIATWRQLDTGPGDEVHPDYLVINKIFYQEIPGLRRRYSTPWQLDLDTLCGRLDDWSQDVLVFGTRAMAWQQAERVWELRFDPENFAHAQLVMDRVTALLGETIIAGDGLVNRAGWAATGLWRRLRRR
jgi:hypothetical protein